MQNTPSFLDSKIFDDTGKRAKFAGVIPSQTLSFSHYEEESRAVASHPSSPYRLQPAPTANA
jgi:hypothetical protein